MLHIRIRKHFITNKWIVYIHITLAYEISMNPWMFRELFGHIFKNSSWNIVFSLWIRLVPNNRPLTHPSEWLHGLCTTQWFLRASAMLKHVIDIVWTSTHKSLYLANDTRYRHGCYGRRIGNRTQAYEWHQFQWPWVTSKPVFKVTILFNVK